MRNAASVRRGMLSVLVVGLCIYWLLLHLPLLIGVPLDEHGGIDLAIFSGLTVFTVAGVWLPLVRWSGMGALAALIWLGVALMSCTLPYKVGYPPSSMWGLVGKWSLPETPDPAFTSVRREPDGGLSRPPAARPSGLSTRPPDSFELEQPELRKAATLALIVHLVAVAALAALLSIPHLSRRLRWVRGIALLAVLAMPFVWSRGITADGVQHAITDFWSSAIAHGLSPTQSQDLRQQSPFATLTDILFG